MDAQQWFVPGFGYAFEVGHVTSGVTGTVYYKYQHVLYGFIIYRQLKDVLTSHMETY